MSEINVGYTKEYADKWASVFKKKKKRKKKKKHEAQFNNKYDRQ